MSTSLYWLPGDARKPNGGWGHPIKGILAKRYLDHDGSLGSEKLTLNGSDLEFLKGVFAGAFPDEKLRDQVEELIDAIERHGEIVIWTE